VNAQQQQQQQQQQDDQQQQQPDSSWSPGKLRSASEEAFSRGEIASAIQYLQHAVGQEPNNPLNHYRMFKIRHRKRQYVQALNHITEAVDLATSTSAKEHDDYKTQKAKLLVQVGLCDFAVAEHESLLDGSLRDAAAYDTARQCQSVIQQANQAFFDEDYRTAANAYSASLQFVEDGSDLLWPKAQSLMELREYYGVVSDTGKLLKLHPQHLEAYHLRGMAFYKLGEHEQAVAHFRAALQSDPEHALNKEGHKLVKKLQKIQKKADGALASNDFATAIAQYERARTVDATNAIFNRQMTLALIKAYSKKGDHKSAIQEAETIVNQNTKKEGNSETLEALWALGEAQQMADMYEQALQTFRDAHQLAPEKSELVGQAAEKVKLAEVALKQSKKKDYYKILGIPRTATAKDIKAAYRKLALQWHPDKVTEEQKEEASKKFQDIGESYEVLSSDELRAKYDRGEEVFDNQGGGGGGHHANNYQFFNQQFQQQGGGGQRQQFHFRQG